MKLRLKLALFKLLIFVSTLSYTQGVNSLDNTIIEDLSDNWLVYEEDYKAYFPFLDRKEKVTSVSQLIDLNRYKSYNLNFTAPPGLNLFVENKLVYSNPTKRSEQVKLPISKLTHTLNNEKEFLTIFNSNGNLPLNHFYIGYGSIQKVSAKNSYLKNEEIIPRSKGYEGSLYILLFLVIIFFVALLKTRYPRKFFEFFGFAKVIPEKDDMMVWDPFGAPFLLFVLINALCSTLIVLVIKKEFDLDAFDFLNIFNSRSVLGVLIATGFFCMIYFIKYIQLGFFGWVFNVRSLVKYQFLELMKVSLKVNIFLTILILIFYGSAYGSVKVDFNYFFYFTIISLIVVLLRVGYLTFTLSGFRNIYLFSYLCTTEILPLVIIAKIILF